jgi:3-dehydroquinate synthase
MLLSGLDRFLDISPHFIIDANIARLYGNNFRSVLDHPNTIIIEATEESKSLEKTIPVFERLVQNRVRRGHNLVAIGGGVVQDITCFVASTLLRGLSWYFVPTTLLAQADSCIGSKSSINLGATKNILGTFNPPESIYINTGFLKTLENKDIRSGVGEILKVHAIEGVDAFNRLAADYDKLFYEPSILKKYIRSALLIKQRFIEVDEFDRGIRNIFNYGHSFGHAIESATGFIVPHGIAVTMGMDMANRIAVLRKLLPEDHYYRMHQVLRKNYENFVNIKIPLDSLLAALMKDKKNTSTKLVLILSLGNDARIERVQIDADDGFRAQCRELFSGMAG